MEVRLHQSNAVFDLITTYVPISAWSSNFLVFRIQIVYIHLLFIPRHTIVAGYYDFTLDVRLSVRPSISRSYVRPSVHISFPDDNLSKHRWIFTKLGMCIGWRSGLGLLMVKFRQFLRSYLLATR